MNTLNINNRLFCVIYNVYGLINLTCLDKHIFLIAWNIDVQKSGL